LKQIQIDFDPGTTADLRLNKIRETVNRLTPFHLVEAWLCKKGYDPIEYGYGDDDLVFADFILITYLQE